MMSPKCSCTLRARHFDTAIDREPQKVLDQGSARLKCGLRHTLAAVCGRLELQSPRQLSKGSKLREGGWAWVVVLGRGTAKWESKGM